MPVFTVTDAGIHAAAIAGANGPSVNITAFKLGSGVNYTPTTSQTALNGSELYSGVPANYAVDSDDVVTYTLSIPATIGDFDFGEVGL